MKSQDIRNSFLDFFSERGHRHFPSAPLVPQDDPTLLFVNAGMVPFKGYFLGDETPPSPRAVSVQKCLRVSGKHNDLEEVGPSPRHQTFFEMMGNFSFGDYFKEEAIRFGWQLVTEVWGLPPAHLFATVFRDDDEAHDLWLRISGLPAERVLRCGEKDNFWAMGDTGPCGPCSEIFVDLTPDAPQVDWETGNDSGRYLEIWNLVFMQYDRAGDGTLRPLPKPSVDTGAGLERVSSVLQGVASNYDTDVFQPILAAAAELAGTRYGADAAADLSLRVVADHLRAVTFLLSDGVIPAADGRGYVLRRILRRAVRHGMRLGFEEPFLHRLLPVVGEQLAGVYPQLDATRQASAATVKAEEEKFLDTVATGARQVQEEIETLRAGDGASAVLPGDVVFRLYDTYGLPLEVIREIAEEERFGLDEGGFEAALEEQRSRSRAATDAGQGRMLALRDALRGDGELPETDFRGYGELELDGAEVLRVALLRGDGAARATAIPAGQEGVAILDRTVFYAEGGGQVGDVGEITWRSEDGRDGGGRARVTDTRKDASGTFFHLVRVEAGSLAQGTKVHLAVDGERRRAVERNHTATHLLHAALREELGEGVRQAGSLVAPDRLRFDFTYPHPVEPEALARIEARVNEQVLRAVATEIEVRDQQEALAAGAMALFGEKYGERVRTVAVPGFSLELCGGCHVGNVGEIGLFLITSERGVASGVRRIEAVTGAGAYRRVRHQAELLARTAEQTGSEPERVPDEVAALRDGLREAEKELSRLRVQMVSGAAASGGGDGAPVEVEGVKVLAREVPPAPVNELRNMADVLRGKIGSGVVVIGTRDPEAGKVTLLAAVTDDLVGRVKAGALVRELAPLVGGGGGGRPDFAQAGGKEPDKLPDALAAVEAAVRAQLAG
jgi:alanyl-tRNA synthetase